MTPSTLSAQICNLLTTFNRNFLFEHNSSTWKTPIYLYLLLTFSAAEKFYDTYSS